MKQTKRFRRWVAKHWATILTWAFLIGGSALLYGTSLVSQTSDVLPEEQAYITSTNTLAETFASPGFLPHRAATYAVSRIGAEHIVWFRMVSVVCAVLAVLCFYYVLHRWYTRRVALIGTILFATSSIVLQFARTALPDILLLSVVGLIAVGLWLQITKRRQRALLVFVATLASTVYVPGLIWVTLGVLVWQGKRLVRVLGKQRVPFRLATIAVIGAVLTPAVVSVSLHPRELLTVAGLPTQLTSIGTYVDHVANTLAGVVWRFDASPSLWVNGTPMLDVISLAMLVLGVYSLRFEQKLLRSKIQLGLLGLGLLLVLAMGPVSIIAIVPMLYLLVTGGFAFMLQQWFAVFPRNPFARTVAVVCITTAILGVAGYHIYRSMVVWPNHPDTRAVTTSQYLIK